MKIAAMQKQFTPSRRRCRPSHRKAVSGMAIMLCLTKPAKAITRTGPTYPRSFDLAIKNQKTKGHDSFAEELRLVHSNIGCEKSAHRRYKECRADPGGHPTSTEAPNAQSDRCRDRNYGNQGQQPAG